MILAVTCMCGSVESLVQNFLKSANYEDWLTVPIYKGKQKSLNILNQLPQVPETEMLKSYLEKASKWAVIIGYDPDTNQLKWSDIAQSRNTKTRVEAETIVEAFA